jgi:hypothetical protein
MSDETDATLALLEACRRRRSLAAEAFRATLAGLHGIHVQVEPVNADAEAAGLRHADLLAQTESALREAGFRVLTPTALFADAPGTPVLHVDVMTVRLDGRYAYSVRLELWQGVRLVREPAISTLALTWSAPQVVGTIDAERLGELCHAVRSAVGDFAQECRAA